MGFLEEPLFVEDSQGHVIKTLDYLATFSTYTARLYRSGNTTYNGFRLGPKAQGAGGYDL
tara:strand:+ start:645 stop:824 length:180 start_codon:yes stop_codon:yes gene_type:complete